MASSASPVSSACCTVFQSGHETQRLSASSSARRRNRRSLAFPGTAMSACAAALVSSRSSEKRTFIRMPLGPGTPCATGGCVRAHSACCSSCAKKSAASVEFAARAASSAATRAGVSTRRGCGARGAGGTGGGVTPAPDRGGGGGGAAAAAARAASETRSRRDANDDIANHEGKEIVCCVARSQPRALPALGTVPETRLTSIPRPTVKVAWVVTVRVRVTSPDSRENYRGSATNLARLLS